MTILSSLAKAYERLPDAPAFGYSEQGIMGCLVIDSGGGIVGEPVCLELDRKGKPATRQVSVPYFGGRSGSKAPPYFLWDNTAYTLGLSLKGYDASQRFFAFREHNLNLLRSCKDHSLTAFIKFLEKWDPEKFNGSLIPEYMIDRNIVFRHIEDKHFIHEGKEARIIWEAAFKPDTIGLGVCLISGEQTEIARLHPPIGTFDNPARIVSFDLDNDAFSSYGHVQAENAPTGIKAAFAYSAVLNRFLKRGSGHRVQIGDASTVFWADASEMEAATQAEIWGGIIFDLDELKRGEESLIVKDVKIKIRRILKGASLAEVEPKLANGVTFFVLGLSPNAARISVRFFWQGDFGELADNYRHYMQDMAFEPWPQGKARPAIRQCVARLGPARITKSGKASKVTFDHDQIPDRYAGEFMRSIISGARFPQAMLSLLLIRIRNDHLVDSTRVAMIKAVLVRDLRLRGLLPTTPDGAEYKEYLMTADPDDPNIARRLGRLFAIMERIQSASLGEDVNATIKDKFLGAAASTPQQVFPNLLPLSEKHLSRLRRGHSDADWIANAARQNGIGTSEMARRIGSRLGAQMGRLAAAFFDTGFPAQHDSNEQGFFMIGYYQERYGSKSGAADEESPVVDADLPNETDEE